MIDCPRAFDKSEINLVLELGSRGDYGGFCFSKCVADTEVVVAPVLQQALLLFLALLSANVLRLQTINMPPKRRAKSKPKTHAAMSDFPAEELLGSAINDVDLSFQKES